MRYVASVPKQDDFVRPILQWASRHSREFNLRQITNAVSNHFNLSAKARKERKLDGKNKIYDRTTWSISHLKKAGLLQRTRRGHYKITDTGRKEAFSSDEVMTKAYLICNFPLYRSGEKTKGFWVYKSWYSKNVTHARIHASRCPHCNNGKGTNTSKIPHGDGHDWERYDDYEEAVEVLENFRREYNCDNVGNCKNCERRGDLPRYPCN